MNETNHFSKLPKFVCLEIFSYFDAQQLSQCAQVSKKFNEMANSNTLNAWKLLHNLCVKNNFINDESVRPNEIKNFLVVSKNGIIKKIKEFVNQMDQNKKAVFNCHFVFGKVFSCFKNSPGKKENKIILELTHGSKRILTYQSWLEDDIKNGADIRSGCLFMKDTPGFPTYTCHLKYNTSLGCTIGEGRYRLVFECPTLSDQTNNAEFQKEIMEIVENRLKGNSRFCILF